MKYSICITHYNNFPTIRQSLDSILTQVDEEYEVVVVDNFSTDGSFEVLKEYADNGLVKLSRVRCSRGRGRQIAFEESTGDYVVGHLDLDDTFKPRLGELLKEYHRAAEGKLLWVSSKVEGAFWGGESILIGPRGVIDALGGWNDLQVYEDWELCRRAASKDLYRWGDFQLLEESNAHPERNSGRLGRLRWKYTRLRDMLRIGRPLQPRSLSPTTRQNIFRFVVGPFIPLFYKTYKNVPNLNWDKSEPRCYVSIGDEGDNLQTVPPD